MNRTLFAPLVLCTISLGCAGTPPVHSDHASVQVIEEYERDIAYTDPVQCNVFLHRRIIDDVARIVEYDARVHDQELSVTYSIEKGSPAPLKVSVYRSAPGVFLESQASDHQLTVLVQNQPTLTVDAYDGSSSMPVQGSQSVQDDAVLELLGCVLPMRAELGAIPAFLLNRASSGALDGQPNISHQSSADQPILDWHGNVSMLGAFLLQGVCLRSDAWSCPCFQWKDSIVGEVHGWCPAGT
jgi:hypothetical protein